MKKILTGLLMACLFFSCSSIKHANIFHYSSFNGKNIDFYFQNRPTSIEIIELENIYINLLHYLENTLCLSVKKGNVNLAILPEENNVCDFEKRRTSAFCYTDRRNIYLLDFNNVSEKNIIKYGPPPENILQSAFTHELTHVFTMPVIEFSQKTYMQERLANFCSLINFKNNDLLLYKDNEDYLTEDLVQIFTKERIQILTKDGITKLIPNNSYEVVYFMLYLHQDKKYDLLKSLILAEDFSDFVDQNNWDTNDTLKFIYWIKEKSEREDF